MLYEDIYIGNTQQTFKKLMAGHFSDIQHMVKNGQKPDSFAAHQEKHFKYAIARNYLLNCTMLKVFNQINTIRGLKLFTETD